MKPCYLELCGVNSFSERAEIDFSSLLEFGIFGIFGDTGSGKSTVLDCISFALYGAVARSRTGSIADVINYQADRAYVNFEFETVYEGKRRKFRVEREVKRKNAVQSARVYEAKEDGAYAALTEGVRESNALLVQIVGLEQKDFEKCIALPQGEFAQFVKSQRSDRLKLISRLFDLEQYGERLVKKTNAKYAACAEEYRLTETRLEPYAEITEEGNRALFERVKALEETEKAQKAALDGARAEEKRLSELFAKRREAEQVKRRLDELKAEKDEISALEGELGRLEAAASACKAAEIFRSALAEAQRSAEALVRAEGERNAAAREAEQAAQWNEERTDEEIERLTKLHTRAEQSDQAEKKRAETARSLEAARRQYAEEIRQFVGFSYEEEKAAIEKRIEALGGGLSALIGEEQAALFQREYAEFVGELTALEQKYPEIREDSQPLIRKYTLLSQGEKKDFSELKREYEARERARAEENRKLLELEKRNGQYRAHLDRLSRLQTDGVRFKAELAEWEKQCAQLQGLSLAETEKQLNALKGEKREKQERRSRAQRLQSEKSAAYAAAAEKDRAAKTAAEQARERLSEALSAGGFRSTDEAEALSARYGNTAEVKARITRFQEEYAAVGARAKELAQTDYAEATVDSLAQAKELLERGERDYEESVRSLAVLRKEHARAEESLAEKRLLEKDRAQAKRRAELYERLKKLFEANKFMDYAAEEYLQNVAGNSSGRLLSLTDGRYFLRYEGGSVGFCVGDNFNGGKTRGVYTLSGGETFLVSLSLALALSAEICARSLRPIEFFFLDEGFGTLDEKLVDTVMDSLERLKSENFAIGIISHVEELKHRINKKLTVEKATERHGSRIFTE